MDKRKAADLITNNNNNTNNNTMNSSSNELDIAEAESWMMVLKDLESPLYVNAGAGARAGASANVSVSSNDCGSSSVCSGNPRRKKRPKLGEEGRKQRNAREQERAQQLTLKLHELKDILTQAGVQWPTQKASKGTILQITCDYIRAMQKQLKEVENMNASYRHMLQAVNKGYHVVEATGTTQAAHMEDKCATLKSAAPSLPATVGSGLTNVDAVEEPSVYKTVFQTIPVGLAITSLGGPIMDCNQVFSNAAQMTQQQLCSKTLFDILDGKDMQFAYQRLQDMLNFDEEQRIKGIPPGTTKTEDSTFVVRANFASGRWCLQVGLLRGQDGSRRFFFVRLLEEGAANMSNSVVASAPLSAADPTSTLMMVNPVVSSSDCSEESFALNNQNQQGNSTNDEDLALHEDWNVNDSAEDNLDTIASFFPFDD